MLSSLIFGSTMSVKEHMIYKGRGFRMFYEATVPAAVGGVPGEHFVSIKNGANTVHLFKRLVSSDQPSVRYEVRTGATFASYPASIAIFPLKAFQSQPTTNLVRTCTVSNIGSLSDLDIVGGSVGVGNRAEGGTLSDPDDLKVLPPLEEYLLRLANPNDEPANVLVYLKWYEIPYTV